MPTPHFDDRGNARMVDVSAKEVTVREATAEARMEMRAETAAMIGSRGGKKGDVLQVARIAAIGGAKLTASLIPLCHAIPIEGVDVEFSFPAPTTLQCRATVRTSAKTGVEMEALTAASTAALTVYDMCKAIDRAMEITRVRLVAKSGGASGDFSRP